MRRFPSEDVIGVTCLLAYPHEVHHDRRKVRVSVVEVLVLSIPGVVDEISIHHLRAIEIASSRPSYSVTFSVMLGTFTLLEGEESLQATSLLN